MLHSGKDSMDPYHGQGFVYRVPCSDCGLQHIGDTKRNSKKQKKDTEAM